MQHHSEIVTVARQDRPRSALVPRLAGDRTFEDLERSEERLPSKTRVIGIDLIEALAEGRRGLADGHREALLPEGDQGVASAMLGVGDRQARDEPLTPDCLD
jgi:hypothetical protein